MDCSVCFLDGAMLHLRAVPGRERCSILQSGFFDGAMLHPTQRRGSGEKREPPFPVCAKFEFC